jgi:transketolase
MNKISQPILNAQGNLCDKMANAVRFLSIDAIERAKSGHPGMPMGMADVATVLFSRFLKFDPTDPNWPDRDRFVLSAGHGSMLLYALLHLTGYEDVTLDELKNFRQMGSRTAGHPEYGHTSGVETTTGPLGQGIANAVGMALAERLMNDRFGDKIVDHHTYAIVGDGCLMEGISHEAISFAGNLGLSKLIVLWDDNSICIDGPTTMTVSDDQMARFRASGWQVQAIDGHDPDTISEAIEAAKASNRPSFIACKTVIGYGAPNKGGTAATHGAPLGDEEIAATRDNLSWPHKPFEISPDIASAWRDVGRQGGCIRKAWEARFHSCDAKLRDEFNRTINGDLPSGWNDDLNILKKRFVGERPTLATRQASGEVLSVLTASIPELIGGSADLTGSVNTRTELTKSITANNFSGRYVHYGVREHAMSAIMNGIAVHGGFIPYAGTFLVFADYMRGGMRLSALMGQRVVYVLTHDSIGLGEDGPTHQPVETLATLRATPNLYVFRPADAVETAECWALAMKRTSSPSCLVLTRQGLPTLHTKYTDENLSSLGAYILAEATGGDRAVTLLATGSEVSIAMTARTVLENEGIPTAVISMPCWELFEEQDPIYREHVLGPQTVRIGIEAAISLGWDRYLGPNGAFVGMQGFGASAPAPELFEHFGITADAVVAEAKRLLNEENN